MKRLLVLLLLGALLLLTACGSGDVTTTTSSTTTTAATTTTAYTTRPRVTKTTPDQLSPSISDPLNAYTFFDTGKETYDVEMYHIRDWGNPDGFLMSIPLIPLSNLNDYSSPDALYDRVEAGNLVFENAFLDIRTRENDSGRTIDYFELENGWNLRKTIGEKSFRLNSVEKEPLRVFKGGEVSEQSLLQAAFAYINEVIPADEQEVAFEELKLYTLTGSFLVSAIEHEGFHTEIEGKTILGYSVQKQNQISGLLTEEMIDVRFDCSGNIHIIEYVDFDMENVPESIDMEQVNATKERALQIVSVFEKHSTTATPYIRVWDGEVVVFLSVYYEQPRVNHHGGWVYVIIH